MYPYGSGTSRNRKLRKEPSPSSRPQLNIRVCAGFLEALRAHPDWTPYDRGFCSGDSGTAKRILYDVLGVELAPERPGPKPKGSES